MSITEMKQINMHLFLFDWFLLLSWDADDVEIFLVCDENISSRQRERHSFPQTVRHIFCINNKLKDTAGFLNKHLLLVTPLLNHVNAKIKLNPPSADQAPGTLHPNAFKTSNNIAAQTNVLCLQTSGGCLRPQYKSVWGFQWQTQSWQRLWSGRTGVRKNPGKYLKSVRHRSPGWVCAWWGRVWAPAGAWSCIIARSVNKTSTTTGEYYSCDLEDFKTSSP